VGVVHVVHAGDEAENANCEKTMPKRRAAATRIHDDLQEEVLGAAGERVGAACIVIR